MSATNSVWGYHAYPSAALSLLPRYGYGATWHDPGRRATLPVPGVSPGAWTDVSPGVYLRRAIAWVVYPAIADNYSSPCVRRLSEGNRPVVRARIGLQLLVHVSVPACRHTLPLRLTLNCLANLLPRMRLWPWWPSAQPPCLARPHMIRSAHRHRRCPRPPHPGRALAVGHCGRSMYRHVSLVAVGVNCIRIDRDTAPLFSRHWRRKREEIRSFSATVDTRPTARNCAGWFYPSLNRARP
jgi:hypothetical protein